ncbi:hypothetical protein BIW11_10095 [Tropilaelaps mercedesae]|uniref:Uncharacterized protein n=1 Tax=Tropilaelaps mercedesae TaxID=418985 RepID=A0A1V9XHH7_9ACAR|nr:hypothetical protein BIW11_10095 [Tropilaelaps mercedesae]
MTGCQKPYSHATRITINMKAAAVILLTFVAAAYGTVIKDVTGGTYDFATGQYSSAITGHVFNSAPVVGAADYDLGYAGHLRYTRHLGVQTWPWDHLYGILRINTYYTFKADINREVKRSSVKNSNMYVFGTDDRYRMEPPPDGQYGLIFPNGSFNGELKFIEDGGADIAMGPFATHPYLFAKVHVAIPPLRGKISILSGMKTAFVSKPVLFTQAFDQWSIPGERGKRYQRHANANSEGLAVTEIYSDRVIKDVREEKGIVLMDDISLRVQVSVFCPRDKGYYYYIGVDGFPDVYAGWTAGRHLGEEFNHAMDMK